ncbi:MAG: outer membrane lipoprotein-sorting protein [Pseudomonadota bacterium]|nr:outer membrane lipoprotein-sorting protein [Pseudomonadota bacterium]
MKLQALRLSLLVLATLGSLAASAIEAPAAPASAPSSAALSSVPALPVEEILARNAAARGGQDAWRKLQGFQYSGKLDAGRQRPQADSQFGSPTISAKERRRERIVRDRELDSAPVISLPFQLYVARGRKSRLEVTVQDKVAVQVYDGSQGWKLRPYLGAGHPVEPYSEEELKLAADQADIEGWLMEAHSKGLQVVGEGVEDVEQRPAYKLRITLANGDQRHVWVDAQSFLDVKVEGARKFDGKIKPMYTVLKDYRTVDGVTIPFLMETSMPGYRDTERLVIEQAKVNPVMPAGGFGKP